MAAARADAARTCCRARPEEGLGVTQAELTRSVRRRVSAHVLDETAAPPAGTAIYALSDPREVAAPRYVGQTRAPRRRFLQHVSVARLWLPDERPWWIAQERLRPLYEWIRGLYADERRLPIMIVKAWHDRPEDATVGERELIQRYLRQQLPLLNVACAAAEPQIRLL
jgi:hypothetical protein